LCALNLISTFLCFIVYQNLCKKYSVLLRIKKLIHISLKCNSIYQ
jgi:hypothetical protein